MNSFKKINISMGWITFILSALVYTLTMEPSASLWDCSEYISTSYKMEIGHPPGAPLFMMINRIFTMFALDVTDVAVMVNFASVIASAATIMFLYWTIAHLALKLIGKTRDTAEPKNAILVYGSAFVGAMAYAFTDTFWFSAVEGEVYAQSSLFTAMVFWAMFKWENESDKTYGTRWLILIAYLMGLSIGVHLLNLLSIPALVMIYYYKMYPAKSKKGWWTAFGFSIILLAIVLFIVIPKTVEVGALMDRVFVDMFGFEKNIGFLFFVVLLMSLLAYGVYYTHKKKQVILNTVLLCLGVLMIGYGTYASVIIRSSVNPPMNSNHPDDAYSLLSFLNREQYGATPLVSGQYYSSPAISSNDGKKYYYDETEKVYKSLVLPESYEFAPGTTTLFPRLWSSQHESGYKDWVNIEGKDINFNGGVVNIPTFAENMEYFFKYQVNYMYWRYFLWNFVGRQNDVQGEGGVMYGNWLSGIDFIDELYLGSQDYLPSDLLENRGRNTYFFLPFLLGLAGVVFQLGRRKNDFVVVSFLFLMTGLAIIFYLNQTPGQPRERDYAYAGSFYAFSIWIGLGVFWVQSIVKKLLKSQTTSSIVAIALAMSVPIILLAQNWDDHDRSHRYVAPDYGQNYLLSTLPNSILLTYGDNDTFGPWYAQEVEGIRTDVRICNLSYIQSDWYARQMKYKFNESAPIEFTIPEDIYGVEINDYINVLPQKDYSDIKDVLRFMKLDNENKRALYKRLGLKEGMELFPSDKIAIPVNKENALKAGIITEEDLPYVVDTIFLDIKVDDNMLQRNQYLFLDMLGTSDWTRPIYLTQSSYVVGDLGLSEYLQFDGFAYKLVPIKSHKSLLKVGKIDTDYLYNKVMNEYKYGNVKDPRVKLDVFNTGYIRSVQLRNIFARLAIELVKEGDIKRGSEVILKSLEELPFSQVGHDYFTGVTVEALDVTGNKEMAEELLQDGVDYYMEYMDYYSNIDFGGKYNLDGNIGSTLQNMLLLYQTARKLGYKEQSEQLRPFLER